MPTGEHFLRPATEPHPYARAVLNRRHFDSLEHARQEYTKAANEYSWLESGFEHGHVTKRDERRACKLSIFMDRVEAYIRKELGMPPSPTAGEYS